METIKWLLIGSLLCSTAFAGEHYRSRKMRWAFQGMHPCPSTHQTTGRCPGYQVDHIRALENGGEDVPSNMQWLTIEEHYQKTLRDNAIHR